jgi:hypothetical protein
LEAKESMTNKFTENECIKEHEIIKDNLIITYDENKMLNRDTNIESDNELLIKLHQNTNELNNELQNKINLQSDINNITSELKYATEMKNYLLISIEELKIK